MKEAIKYFIGEHDFELFVGGDTTKQDYVRTIYDAYIDEKDHQIDFVFIGNGFMQYQIRNMVGTLMKVGNNKIEPKLIETMLNKENKNHIYCAKSCGLCLIEVNYKKKDI